MKKLLISFIVVVGLLMSGVATGDIIDDCIKCPGLQMLLELEYVFIAVV